MPQEKIQILVEGGKATAAPPLGPALGPLGVNIGMVVAEINKKTESFKGMQVPVKVIVDVETKKFNVEVGTPPTSQLILKEANIEKGSSNPLAEKVADLKIEQVIKIAKMKRDSLLGKSMKDAVKEVIGTAGSMGVLIEGKDYKEILKNIDNGAFKQEIETGKTELSAEELRALEEEKKKLSEEIKKRHEELTKKAKEIMAQYAGKESSFIRSRLRDAKIPEEIIKELLPEEEKEKPGGSGAKK